MSKATLKKELKNSSKENLKKEMKGAELSVKDKALQVVYEELEYLCKACDEWENTDNSIVLDPKKVEEINKRYDAAMQYLDDNFSKEFLASSKVQPGPMFNEYAEGNIAKFLENYQRDVEFPLVEPLTNNSALRDFDFKKQKEEHDFINFTNQTNDRIEISPYTQRLQNLIKERTGR